MQKKLIALAVASLVSAPVFAQSQVTVYGTFDGGIRHVDNTNGAGNSKTTMNSSGTYNSNRWGFKGVEDMGNGLKATFNLEGGFMTGTGEGSISGGLFGRKQIVGLAGNWGALDLGRNYNTMFYTQAAYDPFNYKYTGIIPIATLDGARDNNMVTYTSNSMNGLVIRGDYSLGEVAGSSSQGSKTQIGASYANGPFNLGAAFGTGKSVPTAATAAGFAFSTTTGLAVPVAAVAAGPSLTTKQWTLGGGYNFGAFDLKAGYYDRKTDIATGGEAEQKTAWFGGRYALSGANALSAAYYHTKYQNPVAALEGKNKLAIIGFVHNLSKRTELYADIDHRGLDGSQILKTGTDSKTGVTGISVGINHAF